MRLIWLCFAVSVFGQQTLPDWVFTHQPDSFIEVTYPDCLEDENLTLMVKEHQPKVAIINFNEQWNPSDWKYASFILKGFLVTLKAEHSGLLIGFNGPQSTIETILKHELAPYVDGYLFTDIPWIPDEDLTGKGWFRSKANRQNILTLLSDAGAVGAYIVCLDEFIADEEDDAFLRAINQTHAGTMDTQPEIVNLKPGSYQFFFDPGESTYYLAFYGQQEGRTIYFSLKEKMEYEVLFPEDSQTRIKHYGNRLEVTAGMGPHLIKLKMTEPEFQVENVKVKSKASIDPYELVVKNQIFKKNQAGQWSTLQAQQDLNYRYQATTGATVDVTYRDRILWEKGKPIEFVREKMFINGIAWPYEDLPELPLIQPEKVQTEPLVINLDQSYTYSYAGDDDVDGHPTWKVRFEPNSEGNFFRGTVWIDQQNGSHRKIRAIQDGLQPPVVGNEITVFYDWVEQGEKRFWVQVREENLQILNIVGLRVPLQISSTRTDFHIDKPEFSEDKLASYGGDKLILRDTPDGFRYLEKIDGHRTVSERVYSKQKFVVGGVLYDPGMDYPIPLAGFNYINLDFLKKGYQANFFIAGAVNDIIISDSNFLGKGWDLTGELFLSALYFGDSLYRLGEKIDEEEVKKLSESMNVTLGIPLGTFMKFEANAAFRFIDFKDGDDMADSFVLPSSHLENQARMTLFFNRSRFSSKLEYSFVKRSKWESWGLADNPEPLNDSYRKLRFDMSLAKKLPKFQTIQLSARFIKGWDLDRFSRFGFGFFENRVAGFGTSGIEASQAVRLRLGYQRGVAELFQLGIRLDAARAWQDNLAGVTTTLDGSPVDFFGAGFSLNMIGPWKTILRLELGYGIDADLDQEAGDFNGQFVFLKLF